MKIDGDGVVSIASSTAGSAGAGALVVTGGLATGAASYIGGNLTVAGTGTSTFAGAVTIAASSVFGTNVQSGTLTPINVSLGGTYGTNAAGSQANLKLDLFNNSGANRYGLGMSADLFEFQAGSSNNGNFAWFTGNSTERMRLSTAGNLTVSGAATFAGAVTTNGQLIAKGTATNDSAAAGYIGEYVSSTGSGVALTNGVAANIASLVLSAGDWDVSYVALFAGAITGTGTTTSISATSATHNYTVGSYIVSPTVPTVNSDTCHTITERVSTTGATFYFVGSMVFTAGTGTAGGKIHARRVR